MWAPLAKRVDLVLSDRRVQMTPGEHGHHAAEVDAGPGCDYGFSLEGGPVRPDPRSPWQPRGVHGRSRTVDHTAFAWTDDSWRAPALSSVVVYELHVGTYTKAGTFDAATERLGHLGDLGVGAVELMPVAEFDGRRGWGYDGVDLYAPHHAYGGPDGLKRFVDACHSAGLAVIVDVVYNHLGPSGNYLREFGPYFSSKYRTPWGEAVNLDGADAPAVRDFFIGSALAWLRDYHCDGLRLDAVHAIFDQSAIHFLEELAARVKDLREQLGRTLWVIAESDLNDPRLVTPVPSDGLGLDAQWSDDFHHALHAALTGETAGYYSDFGRLDDIGVALRSAYVYAGRYSAYRRRVHGRPVRGLSGHRFLGYLQNHDQVGNRAAGERSGALMSTGRLKIGAALVLTAPFVPMLFMGEEWAASTSWQYFTDHADELGRAVREGRAREFAAFGWRPEDVPDTQDPATFERSKLNWDELGTARAAEILDWHKALIALRRSTPALLSGDLQEIGAELSEEERWLLVTRGPVTIACNLSTGGRFVPIAVARRGRLLLTSAEAPAEGAEGAELPPESVSIWSGTIGAN